MTVLRFRFENHKSFRDVAELSLIHSRLKTVRPVDGTWLDYTHRVAGIYGPNASGKSSVLDALDLMLAVVRNSATLWRNRKRLPHRPFALDEASRNLASSYAVDVVIDDIRFEYGFSLLQDHIESEWLYDYPVGRRRLLYERGLNGEDFKFGRALVGGTAILEKLTGPRELILSRGANDGQPILSKIYDELTEGFEFARFSDGSREQRLNDIVKGLATDTIQMSDIILLLQAADVGIAEVEVDEVQTPPALLKWVDAVRKATVETKGEKPTEKERSGLEAIDNAVDFQFVIDEVTKRLAFRHTGENGKYYTLTPEDQSTGTLSWLSLAVPAVETLRKGGVLLIDEIDASLHPHLAQMLIQMFKDPSINVRCAQLIFTTHDTFFLSPSADVRLDPEEVWLVEKNETGVSEIFTLSDFSTRQDQNLSRRYLHGRYGATPHLAPSFLQGLVPLVEAE
ncbi:ATP/GTP-binding protein [Ornithinimicrobium sp. LYQ121]|uniref:AAA family ATPase n=1 Tax=Ornithinimicrobium sp. LYQ121 TaxID=3378801 RepID=UPI003853D076